MSRDTNGYIVDIVASFENVDNGTKVLTTLNVSSSVLETTKDANAFIVSWIASHPDVLIESLYTDQRTPTNDEYRGIVYPNVIGVHGTSPVPVSKVKRGNKKL